MPRSLQGGWSWPALVAATLAATAFVLVLLAVRLPDVLDPDAPLTAGRAKGLVGFYVLAVGAIAVAALALPRRLLWVPVAVSAAVAALALVATLTVGREAWSFAMALITMGACWRVGHWLLTALRVPAVAAAPPAAWLVGAGVLGLALLFAGRLGLLRWWTVAPPVIALGLSAVPAAWRAVGGRAALHTLTRPGALTRPAAAGAAIVALLLGIAAVFAAAPELMFDSLSSKAWLPHEWARSGSIEPLDEHPLLNLIGFTPVLAIPGHLVDAGGVGRYIQWLSLAGAAGSVWWIARRSPWAPVAAAVVAATPHLFWQATTAYDDAALTLAGVGLAAAFVRLVEAPAASTLTAGLAAGVLAGAAVDLKLHLAPLAAGLVLAWLLVHGPGRLRAATGAVAGGLLVAGPPLLMRWIELGNPLLPNYNHVFGSRYWPTSGGEVSFPASYGSGGAAEGPSVLDRLTNPFDVVLRTATETARMSQAAPDGSFGLVVVALVVAAALLWSRARGARELLILWGGLVVAAVVWYEQFRYLRFILPAGAVAIAALAMAAPRRRMGVWLERGAVVALAGVAALMWPATVAQFWNVPGKDLPAKAALALEGDYGYERRSMPERDAVAAFDRLSDPGDTAWAPLHQRLWLTDGRDLWQKFEVPRRFASAAAPPAGDPTLVRFRKLGIEWVLDARASQLRDVAGVGQLLDEHGEIAWADGGWVLYRLVDAPRAPEPLPCDDPLTGPSPCWDGTLDDRPGLDAAESPTGIARQLAICPGRTLIVDVRVRGDGPPAVVEIDFDFPPRPQPLMRVREELTPAGGGTTRIAATAPPGTRTGARVSIFGAQGRVVERVALGTLGPCRPGLPGSTG